MPARHELPGSFPAHPHLSDVRAVAAGRWTRRAALADRRTGGALSRGVHRLLSRACARRTRPALRDTNPSVVVIRGLGVFGFAKDKREARITTEFFVNAIHVMAGANALEGSGAPDGPLPQARHPKQAGEFTSFRNYVALPRSEAFRIEYWALEEAKLQRAPAEKEFSRRVALVVGAGSGIGREVALRLAARGAHVVVADLHADAATRDGRRRGKARRPPRACSPRRSTSRRATRSAPRCRPPCCSSAASTSLINTAAIYPTPPPGTPVEDVWAVGAAGQRDEQSRAGRRSRRGPRGAAAAGGDRADQFGQRDRAEVRQRAVRRQQSRGEPPDSRTGDAVSARWACASTASRRRRSSPARRCSRAIA